MRLQLYIVRQLAIAFAFAAGGMLFIALPGIAVGAVHKLAGVGTATLLEYLPMVTAGFVPYALPVSFLLALVATYGRLAADNEWTAIRMAGINPYRMLLPALMLGGAVTALVYTMNSVGLPWIRIHQRQIRVDALKNAFKNLSPGQTELNFGEFFLSALYRDRVSDVFYEAIVEVPETDETSAMTLVAQSVRFSFQEEFMVVRLHNAQVVSENQRGTLGFGNESPSLYVRYSKLVEDKDEDYTAPRYLDSWQLLERIRSGELSGNDLRKAVHDFHGRIANALTCLLFILLGASTGILMRRGTQLGALAVAVGYAVAYWIFSLRLGKELALNGAIPAWVGAWGPYLICVAGGVWLTRKAFRQ